MPDRPKRDKVRIGCLMIDPESTHGQRLFVLQILILALIPHVALIVQNCTHLEDITSAIGTSYYFNTNIKLGLEAASSVISLQKERIKVSERLKIKHSDFIDVLELTRVFSTSNRSMSEVPRDVVGGDLLLKLEVPDERSIWSVLSVYEDIGNILLTYLQQQFFSTSSRLTRHLTLCYEFLKSTEELSKCTMVLIFLSEWNYQRYVLQCQEYHLIGLDHLITTRQYLVQLEFFEEAKVVTNVLRVFQTLNLSVDNFKNTPSNDDNQIQVENAMSSLKMTWILHNKLWEITKDLIRKEVRFAYLNVCVAILFVLVVAFGGPIIVLAIKQIAVTMENFAKAIELSSRQMQLERQKSDLLLSRMLPPPVLSRLRASKSVPAEAFESVTVFFSDIIGFTKISANSTPMEIINMLNILYRLFDSKISKYNVYKVETIGDAYMVVSGLPEVNERHAAEIADMALSLMRSLKDAKIPHRQVELLRIRAGIHTGPCVAGVVGVTMPRYSLFGDTINTASRMESTGEAMKIHISIQTKEALDVIGGYIVESRGLIDVSGKGKLETFWLLGKQNEDLETASPAGLRLVDFDQDIIELLIK